MDTHILATIISGVFALVAALGSVTLSELLLRKRLDHQNERSVAPHASSSPKKDLPAPTTDLTREVIWMRPLLIVSASWVLGNISRALRPMLGVGGLQYEALASIVLLVAIALALVVYHRSHNPKRGQGFYQLEVLALWAGFASGWSMVHGYAWEDLIGVCVACWLGCAIVGGIILKLMSKRLI